MQVCHEVTVSVSLFFLKGQKQTLGVSLKLSKVPVAGENISFSVTVTNKANFTRIVGEHVNAQVKEYNRSPVETIWEASQRLKLGPREGNDRSVVVRQHLCVVFPYIGKLSTLIGLLICDIWSLFPSDKAFFSPVSTAAVIQHSIPYAQAMRFLLGDNLVNLAVVLRDDVTMERALAYEEFNISTPQISIQVLVLG